MREIDLIKEFRQRWINGEPYKKLDHTDFIVWKCALLIELAELDLNLEAMSRYSSRAAPLEKRRIEILDQLEAKILGK